MTIAEYKRFQEENTKEYLVENNKEFLKWLDDSVNKGYRCFINIEEQQRLIDNITNWYELKYPERELEDCEDTDIRFKNIKKMSDTMDFTQLLYRLPHTQLCLMDCGYRGKGGVATPVYEQGELIRWNLEVFMSIKRKDCSPIFDFLIRVDEATGKIIEYGGLEEQLVLEENLTVDELLNILEKKNNPELDLSELKECVYDHNSDIELRNRLLQFAALSLLYSENTIPERGYIRAKKLIDEFNKNLNLNLSTEEIDEIMSRNYQNNDNLFQKKSKSLFKSILKK